MPIDDQKIREFLLGCSSERDEEAIGLRLISDEQFSEEIGRAESELVEAHLDGMLSKDEERLFDANFLVSSERRALLDEINALRSATRKLSAAGAEPKRSAAKSDSTRFVSYFRRRPMFALAAILPILIVGVTLAYLLLRDNRTPLEVKYAALNRRDLADPASMQGLTAISLIPGNFRDAGKTAARKGSDLSDAVLFRLELPVPETEGSELEAAIERSGKQIFTVPGRVFRNAFGSELRFIVPKTVLPPGQYTIVVRAVGERNTDVTYQLWIE